MLFPKLLGTSQGLSVSNFWNEYHSGADTCLVFCKQNVRYWHKADMGYCTAHVRYWGKADKFERRGISPATDRRCDVVVYAGFGEPI